ncbi:hypothetical protein [Nonomuraea salmonea]|uniref:Uncharacterized protein n=1 Tax=Nonomuraea salmonea TaxID=46181 RepID=A0ABV5P3B6_9ACTN
MRAQRRPATAAEIVRDLDDRLRKLEHRRGTMVGIPPHAWVVEIDSQGRLIARHAGTGQVHVVAELDTTLPPEPEPDPNPDPEDPEPEPEEPETPPEP